MFQWNYPSMPTTLSLLTNHHSIEPMIINPLLMSSTPLWPTIRFVRVAGISNCICSRSTSHAKFAPKIGMHFCTRNMNNSWASHAYNFLHTIKGPLDLLWDCAFFLSFQVPWGLSKFFTRNSCVEIILTPMFKGKRHMLKSLCLF